MINILVVTGSVRSDRMSARVSQFLSARIKAGGFRATLLDPADVALPLLDRMYKEYTPGTAPAPMQAAAELIVAADAVLVASAEYNHGIPPALKNLMDHFLEEWFHKPAGIACYSAGRFGGVRAAIQLRATLPEMGMPTISSLLPIPEVGDALAEDGTAQEDWLVGAADRFIAELAWWARAAREEAARSGPPFGG